MTEHQHIPPIDPAAPTTNTEGYLSRRSLVRAGLSAAPVLASLKSNSVLAGEYNCIKPSSFSSLAAASMKLSQGRTIKNNYSCKSHGFWKNNGNLDYKKQTLFISNVTGFTMNPSGIFTGKSLQWVLEKTGNDDNTALARHVVAAFLSAVSNADDPDSVILTKLDCQKIWNGQGIWTTSGGTSFTFAQTKAYFETVFGAPFSS